MALEEVTFYNMVGDEINLSNLVLQMINYYNDKLEVGETAITDFNEGSEIRNLLEAFAVLIYNVLEEQNEAIKLPFISTSYGEWLDRIGENPFISLPRVTGDYASGIVTFTLNEIQSNDVVIPADTTITDANSELDFVTESDCTILAGESTGSVEVTCLTTGAEGNCPANSLTIIDDDNINTDLITVNNDEECIGGANYEEDDEYRERLLNNVRKDGFGSLPYYINLAEGVKGVHDVLLIDYPNYTKKILINGDLKPVPDSVLLDVLTEFTDVDKIVLNHRFIVDKTGYTDIDLYIGLNTEKEYTTEVLTEHLLAFFNGGTSETRVEYEGLKINEEISHQILEEVFLTLDGILSVEIYEAGESEQITTLTPDNNSVFKLNNAEFYFEGL